MPSYNPMKQKNSTFNMYFVCSLSLKLTFWLLGACEGDSGSPVTRKISYSGRGRPFYQQEFIVSSGLDCRLRATIYTRVSQRKVLHWIQKISGTQPVVMVVGGFSSHTKEFLRAKAKVNTYILQGTITQSVPPIWKHIQTHFSKTGPQTISDFLW